MKDRFFKKKKKAWWDSNWFYIDHSTCKIPYSVLKATTVIKMTGNALVYF